MPTVTVTEEDLKDQDVWDLNRARELWGKMNEKAMKVASGRGSAIEILQAKLEDPSKSHRFECLESH